ncbi:MAG: 30S ribosomal protein S8 [Patescibacteria group bacterium]|nr:30S ribosomal protein S8 [Patescibacteria group bacterium]
MMTDPISDMLTRIRNAAMVKKTKVELPMSKIKYAIAKILEAEGYLEGVEAFEEAGKPMLRFRVKYDEARRSKVSSLKRISTPGRRVYMKADELPRVLSGFGLAIISTPNGLMTGNEARKRRLGGEIICEVF